MNRWFLIYCKANQEARAEENLARQGFNVFRPKIEVEKAKVGSKVKLKSESLFPRYLFIEVDPQVKSIAPVASTLGVINFVKFGNRYATACEKMINEIKANIDKRTTINALQKDLNNGDEIYVDGHGFDHIKAIYCNPCGNERAMILMNILGSESKLWVPIECLSKCEAKSA